MKFCTYHTRLVMLADREAAINKTQGAINKRQGPFLHGAHCIQKFHLLHFGGWKYSTSAHFKQIRHCVTFCIYSCHCIYYTVLQASPSLYVSLIRL